MSSPDTVHLTDTECWDLLARHVVARLAVDVGGRPDIFPINYVVDDGSIVFKSGAGTKLAGAVLGRHVAVEIDGLDIDGSVWSVVVKGTAREVEDMFERFEIEDLPLYPWVASFKPNYVRIEPDLTTGRRFHVVKRELPDPAKATGASHEHHPGEPRLHPD
jgi:nitroimidazol reductase NimA-like FMN-containing flavoprotein (pyridoxamine 5'-phosphate oxidase superfamily)